MQIEKIIIVVEGKEAEYTFSLPSFGIMSAMKLVDAGYVLNKDFFVEYTEKWD